MNLEKEHDIVLKVLEKYDLSIIDRAHFLMIKFGLNIASDKEFCHTTVIRQQHKEYKSRLERIKALDKVIELYNLFYKEECTKIDVGTPTEKYQSGLHDTIHSSRADSNLDEIIEKICILYDVEAYLEAFEPPDKKIPNSRPVSAKNAGAECICTYLVKNQLSIWKSCEIIAEMLILAGIENKEQDKVKRALYDKFRRTDLNYWD
ncbi:MAG: hypothetical protein O6852_03640 [Gammaproteobacteria bacterium]|nr:hypothetical protein [Gammaproteobacteria bacterium]